jgi:hypothetical protein
MLLATVVIDPPSVIALGAIFVLFMARSIAAGAPLRRSVLTGAFVGGWMGLCFGVMAVKQPAWMLVYLVDPRALPVTAWYPVFLAVMIGSGALGGFWAHRYIAAGRKRAAVMLAGGMLLLWLVLFAVTLQRYLHIGTYDDYFAGRARVLAEQPAVMQDFNLITLVTAVPLVSLLAFIIWRERRLRTAAAR